MAEASDDGQLSVLELGQAALETVGQLTGRRPEAVTGIEWDGEHWQVQVDVVELERIPNTTDVLATYVVQLDQDGTLHGYQRTARFARGQVGGD